MSEQAIFIAALQIADAGRRSAYLSQACAHDAALRKRVDVLLEAHERAGDFLDQPAAAAPTVDLSEPIEGPGTPIGPYKLMEQIGEGGFGLVFVAEQQQPVRRKVALKIIKPGMDTRDVIARFEAERQALALMDHPHIARVLDAGATASGRPFFVMELVRGVPITDYCDQNQLTPRERLELFVDVCHAVQHAHQKGIIHRDLKPSNVLVTLHDGRPVAKVIDFGVAKAIGQQLTEKTIYTRFAQMIGTPLYMSPEQAEMSGLDIDTRSDIYSLGVLLYELLTGSTPFDRKRFATAAFDELRRIICEEEPPRPSTRLSQSGDSLTAIAAQRKTDPARLSKLVRGDLDWIVMKALEKDRSRRYETANAVARDVQRYLTEEPVEACPPSAGYRLKKLMRKHRTAITTAGAFALLLVAGVIASTWQAIRATRAEAAARASESHALDERNHAEKARQAAALSAQLARDAAAAERQARQAASSQAAETAAVLQFMQEHVFDKTTSDGQVTALERKVDEMFQGQPVAEAAVRTSLGLSLVTHFPARALPQLERAVELRRAHQGPEHADTLVSISNLGCAYAHFGFSERALPLLQSTLKLQQTNLGDEHDDTLKTMYNLARAYKTAGNERLAASVMEDYFQRLTARALPADKRSRLQRLYKLGLSMAFNGFPDSAVQSLEEALKLSKEVEDESAPRALIMHYLGGAYVSSGRPALAIPLFRELLRLDSGKNAGWDRINNANLAWAYFESGDYSQAEPYFVQLLAEHKKTLGAYDTKLADTLACVAIIRLHQGKPDEAELLLRECRMIREDKLPDDWNTFETLSLLGEALRGQQEYEDAEPLLVQGYEGMLKRADKISARGKRSLTQTLGRLVQLYEAWDKPEEAAMWRKKWDESNPMPKGNSTQK